MITVNAQFTSMSVASEKLALPIWLYLICITMPVRFMLGPLQMTSLRLLMILLMPLILFRLFKTRRVPTDVLLLLFVGWVFIAMQTNTPAQAAEHTGITLLELFGGYGLARVYIQTNAQFQSLIKVIAALVLMCLPFALFEAFTGAPPVIQLIRSLPLVSSVDIVSIAPRLNLERVQAIFAHPIHFGLFCSTAVAMVFVGLVQTLSWPTRLLLTSLIVCTAFLALSSGAFLAVLIQLFLIGWSFIFASVKHKWWMLVAVCVVAYLCVDLLSNRTPIRVFFSYATFSAHNAYWRGLIFEWGMVNVRNNPLFGLGLNDWVRPHFMYSGSMDNFWLVNAVRYGLPGFGLLASAWAIGIVRVAHGPTGPHKTAWLFCMIGLTFTLSTVHVWTAVYSFVFFLFGAGQFLASASATAPKPTQRPLTYSRPFRSTFTRAVS